MLLGTLRLPYGSSQLTLCKQSIGKTNTPQNNKESLSIRDYVDALEAVGQETRCCLKLLLCLLSVEARAWFSSKEPLSFTYGIVAFPSKAQLYLYLVPASRETLRAAAPGQAHGTEPTPGPGALTCSRGLSLEQTPLSLRKTISMPNTSSYTWVASAILSP